MLHEKAAAAERLAAEAAVLQALRHPNLVEPVDVDADRLRTVRIAGPTLAAQPGADADELAGVIGSVAATLHDLHTAGFVHGALTADHILLADGRRPVLCSLGHPGRPADDIAALGALILQQLEAAQGRPSGDVGVLLRRHRAAHLLSAAAARWMAGGRRAHSLQPGLFAFPTPEAALRRLAARCQHDDPAQRPTAAMVVTAIRDQIPTAHLPTTARTPAPGADGASGQTEAERRDEPLSAPAGSRPPGGPPPEPSGRPAPTPPPGPPPDAVHEQRGGAPPLPPPGPPPDDQILGQPGGATPAPRRRHPGPPPDDAVHEEPGGATPALVAVRRRAGGHRPDREAGAAGEGAAAPTDSSSRPSVVRPGALVLIATLSGAASLALATAAWSGDGPAPAAPPPSSPTTEKGAAMTADRSTNPNGSAASRCAAVPGLRVDADGDGCPEAATYVDGVLTAGRARFAVGQPGDVAATADWTCTGADSLALLRPATGQVWLFDRWAPAGGEVAATQVATVPGATGLERAGGDGCPELVATGPGVRATVDPTPPASPNPGARP